MFLLVMAPFGVFGLYCIVSLCRALLKKERDVNDDPFGRS